MNKIPPFRRKNDPKTLAAFGGLIFTVIVTGGSWLYNLGINKARFENHEERIHAIELTYVPASIHAERDKFRESEIQALQQQYAEQKGELSVIQSKLDQIIGYQQRQQDNNNRRKND